MEIIDNFLSKDEAEKIYSNIMGGIFPWFYSKGIATRDDGLYQMIHIIYLPREPTNLLGKKYLSPYRIIKTPWNEDILVGEVIDPIIGKLPIKHLIRIKANLLTKTNQPRQSPYHTDFENPVTEQSNFGKLKTAIYYVNSNNGYTIFKNGAKVDSVANRMVTFDHDLEHASVTQTDTDSRVVINFNYLEL